MGANVLNFDLVFEQNNLINNYNDDWMDTVNIFADNEEVLSLRGNTQFCDYLNSFSGVVEEIDFGAVSFSEVAVNYTNEHLVTELIEIIMSRIYQGMPELEDRPLRTIRYYVTPVGLSHFRFQVELTFSE